MQYFASFFFYFYSSQSSEMGKIRETTNQLSLALVQQYELQCIMNTFLYDTV